MQMQETIIYLFIVGAFLSVGWMFVARDKEEERLDREANWAKLPIVFRATWGFVTFFEDSLGALLAEWMPKRAQRFADLAVISALPLSANRVLSAACAFGLVGALLGGVAAAALYVAIPSAWTWLSLVVVVGFFLIGWFWPSQNLAHYAERRQQQLTRELPFAIDLIGGAMRSGLEFGAAMRYYISLKTGGPLEEEFGRVMTDVTLGRPFVEALGDMARRVKLEAFTSFVSVVSYGTEIGAPIAQTLKMHGSDLRRARFNLAERKAARAPAVMILPLVLFIMPSVFIIVLTPMIIRFKGAL
jgi:tight adherence protein C